MQFELTKEFIDKITNAVEQDDSNFIVNNVINLHAADIAEILDYINLEQAQFVYKLLESEKASDVLVEIEEDVREKFLATLSSKEIVSSISNIIAKRLL